MAIQRHVDRWTEKEEGSSCNLPSESHRSSVSDDCLVHSGTVKKLGLAMRPIKPLCPIILIRITVFSSTDNLTIVITCSVKCTTITTIAREAFWVATRAKSQS